MPLHRRGNSKTYERLEDLLKEAGYKETRVFTPETERSRSDGPGDGPGDAGESRLSVREGMDAVVGFFAGLLPGAMTSKTSLVPPPESDNSGSAQFTAAPQDYSPSVSHLTNRALQRQRIGGGYDLAEPPTPPTMTSSLESLGEPTSRLTRHPSAGTVNLHAPQTYHSQRSPLPHPYAAHISQQMQKQSSRSSLHHQAIQHHSNIVSPRPSRPNAYVRHMTSEFMLPRPNSTPAHISRPAIFVSDNDNNATHALRVKPDDDDSDLPPLPPSWLESVARAVLFGGAGAYIGGPSSFISHESFPGPPSPSSAKAHVLRSTRSSLSQVSSRRSKYYPQPMNRRSGLSDQTNYPITSTSGSRSTFLEPPSLCSQIGRGRSRKSEGEVSRTRVVCRSAPGSRSGSVTRSDEDKERWRKRARKKEENGRLPSLARTQAEGDVWDREKNEGRTRGGSNNANRDLSGWGADAYSEAGSSPNSEEEEDEELDLARILVPPKRQNSIRSLRMHLASENGSGPSAHASLKSYAARSGSTSRRSGRELYVPVGGNGRDGSGHRGVPRILQRRQTDEDWDGESQEEWGGGWVRRGAGNRESEDEDVDSFVGFFGEGRTNLVGTSKSGSGRNRLGFRGLMGGNNGS